MIHIDGKEINIPDQGYINLIAGYGRMIKEDYLTALEDKNLKEMVRIEKHILSDNFWGEVVGLSSKVMITSLRHSYDEDKYIIIRDKNTLLPIDIIERIDNGES